jgi:hypothetical protein
MNVLLRLDLNHLLPDLFPLSSWDHRQPILIICGTIFYRVARNAELSNAEQLLLGEIQG